MGQRARPINQPIFPRRGRARQWHLGIVRRRILRNEIKFPQFMKREETFAPLTHSHLADTQKETFTFACRCRGLFRESNPGPPAPEAGIIPLDQTATHAHFLLVNLIALSFCFCIDRKTQPTQAYEPTRMEKRSY
jgi:hypothetical protein